MERMPSEASCACNGYVETRNERFVYVVCTRSCRCTCHAHDQQRLMYAPCTRPTTQHGREGPITPRYVRAMHTINDPTQQGGLIAPQNVCSMHTISSALCTYHAHYRRPDTAGSARHSPECTLHAHDDSKGHDDCNGRSRLGGTFCRYAPCTRSTARRNRGGPHCTTLHTFHAHYRQPAPAGRARRSPRYVRSMHTITQTYAHAHDQQRLMYAPRTRLTARHGQEGPITPRYVRAMHTMIPRGTMIPEG